MVDPAKIRSRGQAAKPIAQDLVDWFISQGFGPNLSMDVCAYLIGYLHGAKGLENDPIDILAMVAAGTADAQIDRRESMS